MFALMLRNSSIRSLPLLLFKGSLLSIAVLFVYNLVYAYKHTASLTFEVCTVWVILSLYLALGKIGFRCTHLDLTLPIHTRRLWLAHFLSVLTAGLTMMLVTGAIMAVGSRWLFGLQKQPVSIDRSLLSVAPHMLAGLLFAVASIQSLHPALFRIPGTLGSRLLTAACIAGTLLLLLLIIPYSPVVALIPFLAGLAVAYRNYSLVPTAYAILPREANGAEPLPDEAAGPETKTQPMDEEFISGRASGWFEHQRLLIATVFHCFMKIEGFAKIPGSTFLIMTFIVLWGVLLSGFFTEWRGWEEELRYTFVFITAYILFSGLRKQLMQVFMLDPLPVSRKILFAGLIFPLLLALTAGYGAGRIGIALLNKPDRIIEALDCGGSYCVRVPFEFCQISWDGSPQRISSPWGESHDVWRKPLYKGSRIVLFSPFATMEGSSPDFAALQISRAVESIYGKSISPDEIKTRYFESEGDSTTGLKAAGLTLFEDYPDLERGGDGPFFPVFMMLMGWVWMLMMMVYLRLFRPGIGERARIMVYISLMVIVFSLHFAPFAAAIAKWIKMDAATGFMVILIRNASNAIPAGSLWIWIICSLLFLTSYRLAQRQFNKAEFVYRREEKNE